MIQWKREGGRRVLARDIFGNPTRSIESPMTYKGTGESGNLYTITKTPLGWRNGWGDGPGVQYTSTLRGAKSNAEYYEQEQAA
jgi:hypothetical protein